MTTAELFNSDKMMQLLDAQPLYHEPGHVVIDMDVTENIIQAHKTYQGVAIFSLADTAFGIAVKKILGRLLFLNFAASPFYVRRLLVSD